MVNIADILKYAPKGTELYSLKIGKCKLIEVTNDYDSIKVEYIDENSEKKIFSFDSYGRIPYIENKTYNLYLGNDDSLTWTDLRQPKEDLQPFDYVLVKKFDSSPWKVDLFGAYSKISDEPFYCMTGKYSQCIKYNEDLKDIIGKKTDINVWKNIFKK